MSSRYSYFRPMDESDLDWVMSVETAAYDFPWSRQGFERALDDGLSYVFCDATQQSLGYACFLSVLDEAHLLNLCIAPGHHRQGVASEGLNALIDHFASAAFEVMLLEVRESNPAVRLYKKLGFVEDGVRPNYYPVKSQENGERAAEREDAILMSCRLN